MERKAVSGIMLILFLTLTLNSLLVTPATGAHPFEDFLRNDLLEIADSVDEIDQIYIVYRVILGVYKIEIEYVPNLSDYEKVDLQYYVQHQLESKWYIGYVQPNYIYCWAWVDGEECPPWPGFVIGELLVGLKPVSTPPVHNVDTGLDYVTIQEAINANETLDGHTIFVQSGTYYENVVVNKTVSLIGENRSTTIIDGNATGAVIYVTAKNTKISGFTVQNSTSVPVYDAGIVVYNSSGNNIGYNIIRNNSNGIVPFESNNNTIIGNVVSSNIEAGIRLWYSHGNNISGNTVSNNYVGISIVGAGANFLRNNDMTGNKFNLEVLGDSLSAYFQDIDSSNKVDGKPVYYLLNQSDKQIPSDAGFVAVVNSTNIIVRDLDVTRNGIGILFAYTRQSTIKNVNVSNNGSGIRLFWSSNNTVHDNTITSNRGNGIELYKESKHNNIYENNIKNACIYLRESPSNSISGNNITNSEYGIFLSVSHYNIVSGNNIANNSEGIELRYSLNNILSGNNVTANNRNGILFFVSMNNSITGNNIVDNKHASIYLQSSSSNDITGNTIAYNVDGLGLYESSSNSIFHNDFINNTNQLYLKSDSVNAWDHCNEGNYWSDYEERYPDAKELDDSGIWDTPYFIDENNQDNYPLVKPWSPEPPNPVEATQELIETLETWNLSKGAENSLTSKLDNAIHQLNKGKENVAINKLTVLMSQIEALRDKKLTPEQADYLIAEAQRIIDLING